MTENVTSINQNGNGEVQGVADYMRQKDAQIEFLRAQNERLQNQDEKEPVKLEDVLNRLQPEEGYEPTYELRPLKQRDTKEIRQMLRKFVKNENLQELFGGDPSPEDMLGIVDFIFDELEDELLPWAVEKTGKSPEEWGEEGGSADTDVLRDLKNHPDFLGALRSAASLILTSRKLFGR